MFLLGRFLIELKGLYPILGYCDAIHVELSNVDHGSGFAHQNCLFIVLDSLLNVLFDEYSILIQVSQSSQGLAIPHNC